MIIVACRFTRKALKARTISVRYVTGMSNTRNSETKDEESHGHRDKRNLGEDSTNVTSPRKRRQIIKDDKNDMTVSPIKSALRERTEMSPLVVENSNGLNNAPCFMRTSISLSQLFSVTGGQYHSIGPLNLQRRDYSTCHVSNSIQSSSVVALPSTHYKTIQDEQQRDETEVFQDPAIAGRLVLPREWEYTEFGISHEQSPQSGMEFTVMSYNVLAQKLLEDHGYLYREARTESLQWQYRRKVMLQEMAGHSPDVMCLQEVQEDHFENFFQPQLENLGYRGIYQKRTGDKCDGCAIFYKQDKFSLVKTVPVEYCRGGMLDRDNIALIAELTPKSTMYSGSVEKVYIANTHLLFNPRRGDIKLGQLMILLAELDKCAHISDQDTSAPGYSPVILCGDFNCEPQSAIYKFLVRGYLKYSGLIARFLSGQKEGQYGRDVYMKKHFFCKSFGITDQCQYHDVMLARQAKELSPSSSTSALQEDLTSPGSKDPGQDVGTSGKETTSPTQKSALEFAAENPVHLQQPSSELHLSPLGTSYGFSTSPSDFFQSTMQSGQLWHRLNFVSSYRHTIARLNHQWDEVTTQHDRGACSVDFIFYNVCHKEVKTRRDRIETRNVREGRLRLLKRYGLMSQKEICALGGLPNPLCPSDHVPLISTFLLQN